MKISHVQVEMFEAKLKEMEAEAELLHQQLDGKRRELKDARSKAEEHQETAAIFQIKYTAAIEKARRTHGQLEQLQEELQYSQQQVTQHFISISLKHITFDCVLCPVQLGESQAATRSAQEELAEMRQRYQEKVSQWESAQEALDQLADELEANRNLLMGSQQKADRLQVQTGTLRQQVGALKQQGGAKSQEHVKGTAQPGLPLYYFRTLFGRSHQSAPLAPAA